MAMMEMYIQGVSTRKVKAITPELCRHELSFATISRIVQVLDEELEQFAPRRLEEPYPSGCGCSLRADSRGRNGSGAGGAGCSWHQLGGAAKHTGSGIGEPGEHIHLEVVIALLETTISARS